MEMPISSRPHSGCEGQGDEYCLAANPGPPYMWEAQMLLRPSSVESLAFQDCAVHSSLL